jgi:cobalt-zinc-cadmium resistance protein CzcA
MINKIIQFSINNKLAIGIMMLAWVGVGIYSMNVVPVDAVPDITNNQVQVITVSPNLGTEDIEQFVTYPVELSMANLPDVEEIRSISRFGLSVVTIVFKDKIGTYLPRQLVSEKLADIKSEIPSKFGEPFMGPISTGLGEILQYTLEVDSEFNDKYSSSDLRTYQDWIVNRQMAMLPGVVEVNSFGGDVKQYEVAVNPNKLKSIGVTIIEIYNALEANNENTGGAYIVKNHKANFIKGEGLLTSLEDIENTVVKTINNHPILIKDVATVQFGKAIKYGSVTKNGEQAIGGMIMMLKGANSNLVILDVKTRLKEIEKSLPEGITIVPFLDRSDLIGRTTSTVKTNLVEGGLIVIFILVIFLGNWRGGLIVASTIPLSLLFAYILMNVFGVWSNLMSLGAIDFGIIVDGAVIIIESVVFYTFVNVKKLNKAKLTQTDLNDISYKSSTKMMNASFFGQLIILIVFIPILTLEGIEGKMFIPMAMTFMFAIIGAMVLCLTYVPMMASLVMSKTPSTKIGFGDKFINWLSKIYEPLLVFALRFKLVFLSISVGLLVITILTFSKMGGEFVPQLDEGNLAMHAILRPGSSLEETEKVCNKIEKTLIESFPEITQVVSKIGVAEIPTDPMPMDLADMFIIIKPQSEWETFKTKEELITKIKEKLAYLPGVMYEFSQPLEMRFNELMTGVRQDIAVKLFGEDLDVLAEYAEQMGGIINSVEGVADLKVEAIKGLPQMTVKFNRQKIAQYGLNIVDLNTIIRTAFSGETAGVIYEGEKRFDVVVRLLDEHKQSINDLKNLFIPLSDGNQIPLSELASIDYLAGPVQISREGTNRRTYVGINVRGRDVQTVVNEIQEKLEAQLDLPDGYYIKYGGAFENLKRATSKLAYVVPLALVLIFLLLFLALKSFSQTVMIYMAIPLAAMGGVFALWLRDMPFSISAGVGFIVLFGVAVLNGLVLITSMNELKKEGVGLKERIIQGTKERIRPIFLTASTDILGFLPMAISTSAGAEVQQPLATVVIGGMITASFLTLFIIPILYAMLENRNELKVPKIKLANLILIPMIGGSLLFTNSVSAQGISLNQVIEKVKENNGSLKAMNLEIERIRLLKKTSVGLDKTDIGVQYGQFNGFEKDLGFSIEQKFKFPTTYKYQKELNEALISNMSNQKLMTQNDVIKEVKIVWYQLIFLTKLNELFIYEDSLYTKFNYDTQKKFEAGHTTFLEKINAETKLLESKTKMIDIKERIKNQLIVLQVLVNLDDPITTITDTVSKRKLDFKSEQFSANTNPQVKYFKDLVASKEKQVSVNKSNYLPEFSLGYSNQSMIGNHTVNGIEAYYGSGQRFQSVSATLSIPIFTKATKAKVNAAVIDKEIAETNADYYLKRIESQYEIAVNEYLKYKNQLDYYETEVLDQAMLIIINSEKSYRSGNINTLEYIQSLNMAISLKSKYNNTLNKYNQSIIEIEYLIGK